MKYKNRIKIWIALVFAFLSLNISLPGGQTAPRPGAERPEKYLPILAGRRVGVVANHTSRVGGQHLVDFLIGKGVDIAVIFAPEHGFRGDAPAGENISDGRDPRTGLKVVSLYGPSKKPSAESLRDVEVILFDIQDVGCRFYTYISTLSYVLEAAAEQKKEVIVLDRPNPNGHYIDGPVLEERHASFVGMHPVPAVYGMTIGEYARMAIGEGWLAGGVSCPLIVIPCSDYDRCRPFPLPVPPSPNLPSARAVNLYPSLCFFEGTPVSEGRGTPFPFEVFGHPDFPDRGFRFTPTETKEAESPKLKGRQCYGADLREGEYLDRIHLEWLLWAYRNFPDKGRFFTPFFSKLAGTSHLQRQIEQGLAEEEIRESWRKDLENFKKIRRKYLIYPDFE